MIADNGIQLRDGRILLPMSWTRQHEEPGHSYRALAWYSDDDGQTWTRGRGDVALGKRGAMEPTFIERRDGSVLMLLRTQFGYIFRSESLDGGETWSPARSAGVVGSESPIKVGRIPSTGDLLLIWNHCNDVELSHGGRCPLTTAISRDDGATWESFRDLETDRAHTYSYPSLTFRGNEALITYYRSTHGPLPQAARMSSELHDTESPIDVTGALGAEHGYELKLRILPIEWFYGSS
jgi:sialidase-1